MADMSQISKSGNAKWWVGFAAAFAATFTVSHLETNYSIDFKTFGMDAGVFKGLLEGSFVSFFVWLTPANAVQSITDGILFVRRAFKSWRTAANEPLNGEKP